MTEQKGIDCVNTFTFDLFRILCSDLHKNEFFSPFSVLTALNMTLLGAKNNTEKELLDGLRYSLGFSGSNEVHTFFKKTLLSWQSIRDFTLDIANRVLVHKTEAYSVNAEYCKQLETVYNASVDEVNFVVDNEKVVKTCNDWVNDITKGRIPSILTELDKSTRAVLLNAIYFKGVWVTPFNVENTEMQPFFNFGDTTEAKNVPLMFMTDVKATLYKTEIDGEELQMLELPYEGGIVMNILITKSLDGLKKITPSLSFDIIKNMTKLCNEVKNLWLPKFKMDTSYELVESLIQLGVKDAFSMDADFSGIREEKDIAISNVIHKASIEVNEEGTVADAATAIIAVECCFMRFVEYDFRVDHPFAYFIKDKKSGVILFSGMVNEL